MTRAGRLGCGAIALGLSATIAAEFLGDPDRSRDGAPGSAAAASPPEAHSPLADHTDRWIMTSLARPLFSPHRRPPATQSDGVVAGGPGLPRLAGTLVSAAGRQAIFAAEAGARAVVVGEGGRVGTWTVQSISEGAVDMFGPDGARTLHPTFDRNAAAPAPASLNEHEAGSNQGGLLINRRRPPARPGK